MSVAKFHLKIGGVTKEFNSLTRSHWYVLPLSSGRAGGIRVEFAFASGIDSSIYHLVVRHDMETLCGLKVSRLKSQQALHLIAEVSPRAICKHCERIQQNVESEQGS